MLAIAIANLSNIGNKKKNRIPFWLQKTRFWTIHLRLTAVRFTSLRTSIFAFHHKTGFGELCIHYQVNFYLPMKRSWKCCIISISLTNGRYNGCIEKKKLVWIDALIKK
jgi:hypothetical protein